MKQLVSLLFGMFLFASSARAEVSYAVATVGSYLISSEDAGKPRDQKCHYSRVASGAAPDGSIGLLLTSFKYREMPHCFPKVVVLDPKTLEVVESLDVSGSFTGDNMALMSVMNGSLEFSEANDIFFVTETFLGPDKGTEHRLHSYSGDTRGHVVLPTRAVPMDFVVLDKVKKIYYEGTKREACSMGFDGSNNKCLSGIQSPFRSVKAVLGDDKVLIEARVGDATDIWLFDVTKQSLKRVDFGRARLKAAEPAHRFSNGAVMVEIGFGSVQGYALINLAGEVSATLFHGMYPRATYFHDDTFYSLELGKFFDRDLKEVHSLPNAIAMERSAVMLERGLLARVSGNGVDFVDVSTTKVVATAKATENNRLIRASRDLLVVDGKERLDLYRLLKITSDR